MEGHGIDGINLLNVVLFQPVTFEGVFLLLNFQARVQIFDGDSSFNGAQHIALV